MYIENEGRVDRAVRLVGAATLLYMVITASPLGYIGLYPLITAFFGYDPLYAILGVDTRFSTGTSPSDPTDALPLDGPSGGISMAVAILTGGLAKLHEEEPVPVPVHLTLGRRPRR